MQSRMRRSAAGVLCARVDRTESAIIPVVNTSADPHNVCASKIPECLIRWRNGTYVRALYTDGGFQCRPGSV